MKLLFSFLLAGTFLLAGCFETTQEITLKDDGSGTFTNTNDMSAMLGLAKQMGGKEELAKMGDTHLDTTISLSAMADSLQDLSPENKALVKKGVLKMNMDMSSDKFVTELNLPFNKPEQIAELNKFADGMIQKVIMKQMAGSDKAEGLGDMPAMGSMNDYFTTSYGKGLIERKLNKEKYAGVEQDESMKAIKEISGMGMPMNNTTVINLPRPAKKAEGPNVKLSDDKKKVTIKSTTEDFFDDATKLEYRIEY